MSVPSRVGLFGFITRLGRPASAVSDTDAALGESSARIGCWIADPGQSPSQAAGRHEQANRLARALVDLPEAEREALILQHWHGLTVSQIGERLGRTTAAIGWLLKRGLKRLRERMTDNSAES